LLYFSQNFINFDTNSCYALGTVANVARGGRLHSLLVRYHVDSYTFCP